jgi:hypothetical protein
MNGEVLSVKPRHGSAMFFPNLVLPSTKSSSVISALSMKSTEKPVHPCPLTIDVPLAPMDGQ